MFPQLAHLAPEIQSRDVRFFWDDWNTEVVEEAPDDWLVEHLAMMSDRAAIALASAMSEWVVYRFAPLSDDPHPRQLLEAAWASGADWRYQAETWESVTRNQPWQGPVRGPLGAAMAALDYQLELGRLGGDVSVGARWISNIARHVVPVVGQFREWRDAAATRLIDLYPRSAEDPIGDAVPQEALDMTRDFRVEETEDLMNRFLHTLQPRGHLFLASSEQLVRAGLTRRYSFTLHHDRTERRYW